MTESRAQPVPLGSDAAPAPRPYRMVARAERQEQVRQRILEAMKGAVLTRPYPGIRLSDIARAARVSTPTVHAHFATKELLFLAAIAEMGPEVLALRGRPEPGDVQGVVRGLVRGYERYGDANWGLLPLERESETVAAVLREGRAGHRAWLHEMFAPLLPAGAEGQTTLDALYAATDVGTWKLLRRDLGLSRARVTAAISVLVRGSLGQQKQEET